MSSRTKGLSHCSTRGSWGLGGRVLQAHQVFAKPKSPIVALFQRNSVFSTLIEADLFHIYPVRSGRLGSNLHPSALCLGASTPSSTTHMVHGVSILLSSPLCSCHRTSLHEASETRGRCTCVKSANVFCLYDPQNCCHYFGSIMHWWNLTFF